MKQMSDGARIAELFLKVGFIIAVAAVLLAPMTIKTDGGDAAPLAASRNG